MRESLDALDSLFRTVINTMTDGRLVPFHGAGVNLCGRPHDVAWQRRQYLPSGGELSTYLAENFGYRGRDMSDRVCVSQFIAVVTGSGPLYEELHTLFDVDYPPTPLHQLLATLPAFLREKGYLPGQQLIVTTNYDDLIERTFQAAGQPFDPVSYVAEGGQRRQFMHWPPESEARLIEKPNEYHGPALDQRPLILKIHGTADRANAELPIILGGNYASAASGNQPKCESSITWLAEMEG